MFKKKKNKDLYLSDLQPLTAAGKVALTISYLILFIWAAIILVPLVIMVVSSFNGNQGQYISMTGDFVFSVNNFKYLFEKTQFLRWVVNTLKIATATTILTLIFVSFTGYAYSRFRFKGKKASLITIMLVQIIPAFAGITAYYAIHTIISGVVPVFSRPMMLILIYSGGAIAGNTFILKGYLDSISQELDEAARIDGCSNFQVYRLIIMPLARPMLAIIALQCFIGPFLDYMMPKILLTNPADYTLATGLFTLISDVRNMNQPAFAAGGFLSAIPVMLLFLFLQDELVGGLSSGAVKG
ncbi:sugar ABC transporter permease [Anaerococcus degeneri]|uniref:Sugar ABC transporter permease n=1 Tax=Anaerococcus degeneri TaxID=361500 RepID=A0ABS7YWN8_9FIRM|nr:sugar ABC transporter permease [Anaerococcus degeneri]MBP2015260.1 arabinogalactan oligomer/maltooligosaccharide transport system permease protein [Anaerococcus degeneri]MCA2096156.1 sugar ABC transporter permease [Anaerococcus degeneri]